MTWNPGSRVTPRLIWHLLPYILQAPGRPISSKHINEPGSFSTPWSLGMGKIPPFNRESLHILIMGIINPYGLGLMSLSPIIWKSWEFIDPSTYKRTPWVYPPNGSLQDVAQKRIRILKDQSKYLPYNGRIGLYTQDILYYTPTPITLQWLIV